MSASNCWQNITVSEEEHAPSPIGSEKVLGGIKLWIQWKLTQCHDAICLTVFSFGEWAKFSCPQRVKSPHVFPFSWGSSECLHYQAEDETNNIVYFMPFQVQHTGFQIKCTKVHCAEYCGDIIKTKWSKCGGRIINIEDSAGKCWQPEKGTLAFFWNRIQRTESRWR